MENIVISNRNTSLHWSQPSSVVFAWKTATLGPELQVSMGPRPHLRFFAFKTATLAPELQVSMGPNPHLRGTGTSPAGPAAAGPMFTPSLRHDDVTLALRDVIET